MTANSRDDIAAPAMKKKATIRSKEAVLATADGESPEGIS